MISFRLTAMALITLSWACTDTIKQTSESRLVEVELAPDRYNVAFLITDGVYNTELTAPYDIFHHTIFREGVKAMNVFTVSNTSDYVTTFEGLHLAPNFNFLEDDLPPIDMLVVPSGEHHLGSDLEDGDLLDFVRKTSADAQYVMSHCDGAFLLAKSGVLDGSESTTFPGDIDTYREMFPQLAIHEDVLFVHDGKFITSAGGAKSFEASLYLCEILYGKKVADQLAAGMVIDWNLNELKYIIVPTQLPIQLELLSPAQKEIIDALNEADTSGYLAASRPVLFQIQGMGNDEDQTRYTQAIHQPVDLMIYALGEIETGEMMDYGWIEEEGSGKVLWQMKNKPYVHAGGDPRNIKVIDSIRLPPGDYRLRYRSNDRHSNDGWVGKPPERPFYYGITAFNMTAIPRILEAFKETE